MHPAIEQMIFRNLTPLSIRHLRPPEIARAEGLEAAVYRQLEQEFQAVPPITMHHLDPGLMAGVWSACRETLVAGPGRAVREAVAVAVSKSNRCPYCVEAHTSMLDGCAARPEVPAGIVEWAAATGDQAKVSSIVPPFPRNSAPAVIGTAVIFHYINRMVNIFLDDTMMPVIGKVPLLRQPALSLFSSLVSGRIVSLEVAPGRFLSEAPGIPLPVEFLWAEADPAVSGGLLRFAAAAEEAGRLIDARVREVVVNTLDAWSGSGSGFGNGGVDQAVACLTERLRPQARIALLAAVASWAVDDTEVKAFFDAGRDERSLLDTAAWGSWQAARRIAGWLMPPSELT